MQILEYQLIAKTGRQETCEDAIVVTDHFVAVLDGATSVAGGEGGYRSPSPGRKAVDRIASVFDELEPDISLHDCIRNLDAVVAQIYEDEGQYTLARDDPEYRTSAAAVIYSRAQSQVWLIGDCQGFVGDRIISAQKNADRLLSEVRAMFLESEILRGWSTAELQERDTGREFISELLRRQKRFQNIEREMSYSYSVLDGFLNDIERAVQVYPVPEQCREIVLASDGYPVLRRSLTASERELEQILAEDPLCFRRFKTTKGVYRDNLSFDDRAYIRVSL